MVSADVKIFGRDYFVSRISTRFIIFELIFIRFLSIKFSRTARSTASLYLDPWDIFARKCKLAFIIILYIIGGFQNKVVADFKGIIQKLVFCFIVALIYGRGFFYADAIIILRFIFSPYIINVLQVSVFASVMVVNETLPA